MHKWLRAPATAGALALTANIALAATSTITVGPDFDDSWDVQGQPGNQISLQTNGFSLPAKFNGVSGTVTFGQTYIQAGPLNGAGMFPVSLETPTWTFAWSFPAGTASGAINVGTVQNAADPVLNGSFTVTNATGIFTPLSMYTKPTFQATLGPIDLTARPLDTRDSSTSATFTWGSPSGPVCIPVTCP